MERFKGHAAVICEFNPFHHGHANLLNKAKEKYSKVFGIMSGNLVQRGGNACADKYARAAAAVECGYDGVFELPFPYSGLSAKDFAAAGVFIAEELGMEALVFGSEDPKALTSAADIVCSHDFEERVSNLIKTQKNLSYPKAVQRILSQALGEETAKTVCSPNNILGLEYIKAISKRNILDYHIVQRDDSFESAGALRKDGVDTSHLPENAAPFFEKILPDGEIFPYCAAFAQLYTGDKAVLYGIDESLAGRITKALRECKSFEEMLSYCRSANDTDARIRRAFISILFNITKYQAVKNPDYTLVLAFDPAVGDFVKKVCSNPNFTVSVKPADLKDKQSFAQALRCERVLRGLFDTADPLNRVPHIKGGKK